ncbi:sulfate adenylyltransferase subunit CysD [Buchnera aphidicola (Thelaxes californica)]|uniref:Sulfate adenylyltransferase subunit 2 n=1 Tax=Buchnera aphidicola (Thelaxes californica) TaxID=1315998 RepID=A0A4D6YLG7_9GAMM|nr:sulfate adenylyltransferase subunit CysD [Buchnera aphidicola]QCI26850.1 sulfate adenylyltransferase subunit CysD [Buchnera aphidicola (Thelaxes californica)]
MKKKGFTYLTQLESESISIIREVASEFINPVMLYSLGKDSSVMLHLAKKAFYPGKIPFPLLHIDTQWKFREMYTFRDLLIKKMDIDLIIHINEEGKKHVLNPFYNKDVAKYTEIMKTDALKQAIEKYKFDAAFGGARRDEEKSRSKERIYSFRDIWHKWDPKKQRPELWNIYNGQIFQGESIRVFPLSNWTELDIWQYIYLENIEIVPLYFSKKRPTIKRNKMLLMIDDDRIQLNKNEKIKLRNIRFRTLGCWPLTSAIKSNATTLSDIIQEMLLMHTSERTGRMIDHNASDSMEFKKKKGYF